MNLTNFLSDNPASTLAKAFNKADKATAGITQFVSALEESNDGLHEAIVQGVTKTEDLVKQRQAIDKELEATNQLINQANEKIAANDSLIEKVKVFLG